MNEKEKMFNEVNEVISDGQEEISETRKIVYDERTGQFSMKIPKSLALKAHLKKDSELVVVFNPREETRQKLNKSKLILYLKEADDGGEKDT